MNWRLSKKRNKQRGVAAVETALLTLFLISIAIGVAEFGRAIFYFESLAKGARAAARYAVVFKSSRTNFAAEARNLALCGLTSCPVNGTRIAPGLTLSNISVSFGGPGGTAALTNVAAETTGVSPATPLYYGTMDLVTVTISPTTSPYNFPLITGFFVGSIALRPISVTMAAQ